MLRSLRAVAAVVTLAPAVASTPARADLPKRIVVVAGPEDRFYLRLVAELELLGIRVVRVDPRREGDKPTRESLEHEAEAADAIASIQGVPSERGVEVWIADRVTGKTVLRDLAAPKGAADDDPALAARTVELLRASILETTMPEAPRTRVAPPPSLAPIPSAAPGSALERTPSSREPMLALEFGAALVATTGGVGAAAGLEIGVSVVPSRYVGGAAFASIPLASPALSRGTNKVQVSSLLGGVGVRVVLVPSAPTVSPSAEAGVAVASVRAEGTPGIGNASTPESALSAGPYLDVGAAIATLPHVRLRADVRGLLLTREIAIDVVGKPAATFGPVMVLATLGGEFRLR